MCPLANHLIEVTQTDDMVANEGDLTAILRVDDNGFGVVLLDELPGHIRQEITFLVFHPLDVVESIDRVLTALGRLLQNGKPGEDCLGNAQVNSGKRARLLFSAHVTCSSW
jgi:hypothetical protein